MGYNLYLSALLMVVTCCSLFIAYLAWRRREFPISVSLCLGMLAGALYSFGYAFEIVSSNLEQIRFWLRIEYIGISFGTLIWFTMVLQYTNRQAFLRKWVLVLLAVVPLLTFASHYTNEWHHLFYKTIVIDESAGFPLAAMTVGPFYKLHVIYSYLLFVIGMVLLLQMYGEAISSMKRQIALMMIGSCAPYLITLLYLSGVLSTRIDFSSCSFLFSGVFYIWGIYQFHMLKLAPLALQKVFESMQDGVIVLDLDNSITSCNQSAMGIISELRDKKSIGRPAGEIFAAYPRLLESIGNGSSLDRRVMITNQMDLTSKSYNVHVSPICDRRQKPVGKMLLLSDVTEAVLAEETLRTNAKQLSELNTFKDKMFTVIAHDIRDPLTVLVSLMDLLREEMQECGENHGEVVDEMGQQIQKTFTLVESLLDWFRSQRGGMMFNPAVWNLSEAVQSSMQLSQVRSEAKCIHIRSDIPQDTFVYADKEMLDLVLRNLLSNAVKFTGYGGRIQVEACLGGDKVILSIRDTGQGVPPDQAGSLLQEDNPTSFEGTAGERGAGFGLTLCREFVQINGGEIWFESSQGQGSVFSFSIPLPTEEPDGRRSAG